MPTYLIVGLHSWSKRIYREIRNESPVGDVWLFCDDPDKLEETILKYCPKKIFFVHWSYKVPKYYTDKYECVCFHPTFLPYGRGGTPIQNMIEMGDEITALTAFKMTDEIDAGPMYARDYNISLEGRAQDIYNRIANRTIRLIRYIVRNTIELEEQRGEVTYFKRRIPEDSVLVANQPLEKQYDFIRMLDAENYPHAYLYYGIYRLEFTDAQLKDGKLTAKVTFEDVSK